MKKLLMVCAFALAGVTSVNAGIAVGIVTNGGWATGWGASSTGFGVSLGLGSLEEVSWEFGLRFSVVTNGFGLGVDADMHVFQKEITDWVAFYVGVGPYVGFSTWSHKTDNWGIGYKESRINVAAGVRVPLGFRFMLIDHLDIWLAFLPTAGFGYSKWSQVWNDDIAPKSSKNYFGFSGGVGAELGVRWWF